MSINKHNLPCDIGLDTDITSCDITGQYTTLAAPIKLTGQLKLATLITDYYSVAEYSEGSKAPLQLGVDEAGRGPLLGSVNVAAAILPSAWSNIIDHQPLKNTPLSILTDSKKLSEKKRDILYPLVQQHTLGYIIAEIPAAVIDQLNILQATMLGMRLCTEALLEALVKEIISHQISKTCTAQKCCFEVLFDGNRCPELDYDRLSTAGLSPSAVDCQAWVKGDARHTSIAAASILAKVSRDKAMYDLDRTYPQYGIAQHKGYPTKAHLQAIEHYGVLAEHRLSFAPIIKALKV